MYDTETKNQFIELRAQGLSLDAISAQLSVPKTTLGRWHHESLEQIQRLRSLQWHLLEEQIGHRLEDSLHRIAQRIRRWEDELDTRDPHCRTTPELVRIIRDSRREYLQLRALLLAPLQPTRRRIACLTSLDPQKRDKTRQTSDALDTTSSPTNDLQQPEPTMSHSDSHVTRLTSEHNIANENVAAGVSPASEPGVPPGDHPIPSNASPALPRGEGWGEGQTGSFDRSLAEQSQIQNLQSKIDSASQRLCVEELETAGQGCPAHWQAGRLPLPTLAVIAGESAVPARPLDS